MSSYYRRSEAVSNYVEFFVGRSGVLICILGDPVAIHPFLAEINKERRNSVDGDLDTGAAALHLAVRCGSRTLWHIWYILMNIHGVLNSSNCRLVVGPPGHLAKRDTSVWVRNNSSTPSSVTRTSRHCEPFT